MPPTPRPRNGLTLVEVLVAIIVFSAGILATAGSQLAVARLSHNVVAQRTIASHANNILDSLRATPCASLAAGTNNTSLASFAWQVTQLTDLAALRVDIVPATIGAPWSVHTLMPCAR